MADGRRLDRERQALAPAAEQDVLALVPARFRDCARLRLLRAQCRTAPPHARPGLEAELVRSFDQVRKEAMDAMMQQAGCEAATKADVIRLVHSFGDLAEAMRKDVAGLAESAGQTTSRLEATVTMLRAMEIEVERLTRTVRGLRYAALAAGALIVYLVVR
jgi:chemotaxis protein histidine kinase CheA